LGAGSENLGAKESENVGEIFIAFLLGFGVIAVTV
jgi:hypothetical protein